jgi:regulator of replication initiation timing
LETDNGLLHDENQELRKKETEMVVETQDLRHYKSIAERALDASVYDKEHLQQQITRESQKVTKLKTENGRLITENGRLITENQQLKGAYQNAILLQQQMLQDMVKMDRSYKDLIVGIMRANNSNTQGTNAYVDELKKQFAFMKLQRDCAVEQLKILRCDSCITYAAFTAKIATLQKQNVALNAEQARSLEKLQLKYDKDDLLSVVQHFEDEHARSLEKLELKYDEDLLNQSNAAEEDKKHALDNQYATLMGAIAKAKETNLARIEQMQQNKKDDIEEAVNAAIEGQKVETADAIEDAVNAAIEAQKADAAQDSRRLQNLYQAAHDDNQIQLARGQSNMALARVNICKVLALLHNAKANLAVTADATTEDTLTEAEQLLNRIVTTAHFDGDQ